MRRWYLIHTKPSSEMLALTKLLRQSYEVYLPRVVQTARRAALRCERIAALVPHYLGAPVRVSHGDGLDSVFERQAGSERVVVLLRGLGQNGSVCVPADCGALTAV